MRHTNYSGGSCLWAAFQDVLSWQHHESEAAWVRQNYSGAAGVSAAAAVCDKLNLDYAMTTTGDVAFLEWCSRTRRGAAIHWQGGAHAITFCGFVGDTAVLIDNNNPAHEQRIPRQQFLSEWLGSDGGCALTLVSTPAPPRPWL
jgi:hypothetical protein